LLLSFFCIFSEYSLKKPKNRSFLPKTENILRGAFLTLSLYHNS
jgi:hypothetical protein